jgi:hypothetical protein
MPTVKPARIAPGSIVAQRRDVLTTIVDGEVMALNVDSEMIIGLDPIASRIWDLIAEPVSIGAVCDMLVCEFEVEPETCLKDLLATLEDLATDGLINIAAS